MIPQLALSVGALYSVGRAVDNVRFWRDYYANTGKIPKYPFRSGAMDSLGYTSDAGFNYYLLKRM